MGPEPQESWSDWLKRVYQTRMRYYIPVLSWAPKYRWKRDFRHDLLAGISVAFLMIPQSLSFAQALVKIPPVHGLYTAMFPCILYALLGTSRQLSVGPEALVSILVGASVKEWSAWQSSQRPHSPTSFLFSTFSLSGASTPPILPPPADTLPLPLVSVAEKVGIATLMGLMVGIITFCMGFFRLGFIDSVLSRALLRGFVLAVACVVMIDMSDTLLGIHPPTGQCPDGLSTTRIPPVTHSSPLDPRLEDSESPIQKLLNTLSHLTDTHLLTALVSLFSVSFLFGIRYLKSHPKLQRAHPWIKFFPDILFLVLVSTLLCQFFRWDCYGLAILNRIQATSKYEYPRFPPLTLENVRFLTLNSILISVIGFVESIAAGKTYASKYNYSISPNRELVAIGTANLVSALFGGYPAFGSLGRTAVNDSAGSKTQLAGGITGLLVIIVSLFLLPFFEFLPKAVCSSIIVAAAVKLVELEDVYFIIRLR
jgi:MFS superfamily sulfate permease-like transporter